MNAFEQRKRNDITGLWWIDHFGWLRTAELGSLLWPGVRYNRTRADRLVRGWLARKLVLERRLPDGAGRAIVLSLNGARLLGEAGYPASTGKDFGSGSGAAWRPPGSWKHDLLAAGLLADLSRRGYQVDSERSLRQQNPKLVKLPDGLATKGAQVYWIEVESARKTGPAKKALVQAVCRIPTERVEKVNGLAPNVALIAYVPGQHDERGYHLDHRARITQALSLWARQDVKIVWAVCRLSGQGVTEIHYEDEIVTAAPINDLVLRLRNCGWVRHEHGYLYCQYGDHRPALWEEDKDVWGCMLVEGEAVRVDSQESAERWCASAILKKMNRL